MPKIRPHKGAVKRFRVTKNGKVVCARAFSQHLKAKKSAKRRRRLRSVGPISKPEARRVKQLLGMI